MHATFFRVKEDFTVNVTLGVATVHRGDDVDTVSTDSLRKLASAHLTEKEQEVIEKLLRFSRFIDDSAFSLHAVSNKFGNRVVLSLDCPAQPDDEVRIARIRYVARKAKAKLHEIDHGNPIGSTVFTLRWDVEHMTQSQFSAKLAFISKTIQASWSDSSPPDLAATIKAIRARQAKIR